MTPIHCQKDYSNGNIILQYSGIFNYPKAIEFIKQSYSDVKGIVIIEHTVPSFFCEYENYGSVTFKN